MDALPGWRRSENGGVGAGLPSDTFDTDSSCKEPLVTLKCSPHGTTQPAPLALRFVRWLSYISALVQHRIFLWTSILCSCQQQTSRFAKRGILRRVQRCSHRACEKLQDCFDARRVLARALAALRWTRTACATQSAGPCQRRWSVPGSLARATAAGTQGSDHGA